MRTATRRNQHTRSRRSSIIPALNLNGHHVRRRKFMSLSLGNGRGQLSRFYAHPIKSMRKKPYMSLGAVVALSTAAGLLIWYLKK